MKTMTLHKRFLQIIIFSTTLMSCEPGVEYSRIVQNDSDFDLTVIQFTSDHCRYDSEDTVFIGAHSSTLLGHYDFIGRPIDFEDCQSCADSIWVHVNNQPGRAVTIDFNHRSNWKFDLIKKKLNRGGVCECRLVLNNDMVK